MLEDGYLILRFNCGDRSALHRIYDKYKDDLMSLAAALQQLPYEQREVLLLRAHSRMRFAAIAKTQGVSINTVQGRYRYAVDRLRAMLDSEAKP